MRPLSVLLLLFVCGRLVFPFSSLICVKSLCRFSSCPCMHVPVRRYLLPGVRVRCIAWFLVVCCFLLRSSWCLIIDLVHTRPTPIITHPPTPTNPLSFFRFDLVLCKDLLLRGTIVNRTYGIHTTNIHIDLFLRTIFYLVLLTMVPRNMFL